MQFGTVTSTDELDLNWQRFAALTNAMERNRLGVLTGSPSPMRAVRSRAAPRVQTPPRVAIFARPRIPCDSPRASCRRVGAGAVVLLEPWYHFELEVPRCVGRALSDATRA